MNESAKESKRNELIARLFDELTSVPVPARDAAIEKADLPADVRAELKLLIQFDADAEQGTDVFAALAQLNVSAMLPPALSCFTMLGKDIGQYRIVEVLGHGGFGCVYAAVRNGAYQHRVAIKVMRGDRQAHATMVKRFELERQLLAELNHEYISRILDGGQTEDGSLYFVMEYIPGEIITDYCDKRRLSVDERLQLYLKVCDAVAYAHQMGIVHRDLKPSNVLVTSDGVPKLVDFGIAKVIEPQRLAVTDLTYTSVTPITPCYASPEQLRAEPCTLASDVYSLGVVLYELLVGIRPFANRAGSVHQLIQAILTEMPHIPSKALNSDASNSDRQSPTTSAHAGILGNHSDIERIAQQHFTTKSGLAKRIRGDLDNIVMMAIRKEPLRRYNSARDLADDIRRHFDGQPVRASGDSIAYVTSKFIRRHTVGIGIATFLLSQLVLLPAAAIWHHTRMKREEQAHLRSMHALEHVHNRLPLIQRLHDERRYFDGFYLAKEALETVPENTELQSLIDGMSKEVTIQSSPQNAEVWMRPSTDPTRAWQHLGKTPLTCQVPTSVMHWRICKEGFQDLIVLDHVNNVSRRVFDLSANSQAPESMVHVAGSTKAMLYAFGEFVEIKQPFYVDKYEVTNEDYQRFVDERGYQRPELWPRVVRNGTEIPFNEAVSMFVDQTRLPGPSTWSNGRFPVGQETYPVHGVSWYEATAYATFVKSALPTIYHWYAAADTSRLASVAPNSNLEGATVAPVGKFVGIGTYGTLDMAGNVREWCSTSTDDEQRYVLGGMWSDPTYMFGEPAVRSPFERPEGTGFRCVRYTSDLDERFLIHHPLELRDFDQVAECPDEEFETYIREFYNYDKDSLDFQIDPETMMYGHRCRKVTFTPAYESDDQVIAYLYLPDSDQFAPPYQTLVYFPGGYATTSNESGPPWPTEYLTMGRAVLFPIYWGTYQRRRSSFEVPQPRINRDYDEAVRKIVLDFRRSIDVLEQLPELVDTGRLGYYGYSWGAAIAPILLAIDDRCKTAILNCGGATQTAANKWVETLTFCPRVQAATLMLNCKNDAIFPNASQLAVYNRLPLVEERTKRRRVYEVDTGHSVPREGLVGEAISWMNRHLGEPKTPSKP